MGTKTFGLDSHLSIILRGLKVCRLALASLAFWVTYWRSKHALSYLVVWPAVALALSSSEDGGASGGASHGQAGSPVCPGC